MARRADALGSQPPRPVVEPFRYRSDAALGNTDQDHTSPLGRSRCTPGPGRQFTVIHATVGPGMRAGDGRRLPGTTASPARGRADARTNNTSNGTCYS